MVEHGVALSSTELGVALGYFPSLLGELLPQDSVAVPEPSHAGRDGGEGAFGAIEGAAARSQEDSVRLVQLVE